MARKKATTKTIEEEAKTFIEKKKKSTPKKEITPRMLLAGSIVAGFIASGTRASSEEVMKEVWRWVSLIEETEGS